MNHPFSYNYFDLIIAESVTIFTLIPNALREYVRVLRPNGTLVDVEMTAEKCIIGDKLGDFQAFYGIKQIPTESEWCKHVEKAGLSSVQILKGGTVASTFKKNDSTHDEIPDFNPSKTINPKLHSIWNEHQEFTKHYSSLLGYRVYRSRKDLPLS